MNTTEKVVKLFDDLIAEGEKIKQTCKKLYFSGQKKQISPETFEEWKTKSLSLLKSTFGSSSPQYDSFANAKFFDYYNSTQIYLGILKGAREDLHRGYFFHKDLMLSVNIYDSMIERAKRKLATGELFKGKVILETVLQEILVKICENKRLPYSDSNTIQSIAEALRAAQILPEKVKERLLELHGLFASQAADQDRSELESAAGWILLFLNDFLGAQILILN